MDQTAQLIAAADGVGEGILGAIALAFVFTLGLFAVYVLARRSARQSAQEGVEQAVAELRERLEGLAEDLRLARESSGRAERPGTVDEIGASIELDEVLARTIDAAVALPGADAAMVRVEVGEEAPIIAAVGISADEAERQRFAQPPDADAEAIVTSYRYRPEVEGGRIRASLALPLAAADRSVGWLAVYAAARGPALDDVAESLRDIARRAAPAIENALRFREARRLADLDALTGLHNRRYFYETLEREVARAHRYRRRLALIVVDVDDFKTVNEQIGHLAGDGVLADAAERIRTVVRQADVACRVGGDEFAIVLPESGLTQADQLFRRVQAAVAIPSTANVRRLTFSAGFAELTPDDDATSLFERADAALYQAKRAGKARALPALVPAPPGAVESTAS